MAECTSFGEGGSIPCRRGFAVNAHQAGIYGVQHSQTFIKLAVKKRTYG